MSDRKALIEAITAYLTGGGLFNPELANHNAVRDLLIDCRAALQSGVAHAAEPLWIYEDALPDGYPYDALFAQSKVVYGVRMFPVYAAPAPADAHSTGRGSNPTRHDRGIDETAD